MRSVRIAVALAAVGMLACTSWTVAADADTVPLVLVKPAGQSGFDLADDDNELAHFRYRARFSYGYSPYRYSYSFNYRPFAYNYAYSYRPYYAYSYRPFYAYSYRPYYYPRYSFSIGVGSGCYYYPISMQLVSSALAPLDCLPDGLVPDGGIAPATPGTPDTTPGPATPTTPAPAPAPMPKPDEGTFPYDGGPSTPAPMPQADPAGDKAAPKGPGVEVPPSGRLVSHTAEPAPEAKSKWVYPAYGEKPRRTDR